MKQKRKLMKLFEKMKELESFEGLEYNLEELLSDYALIMKASIYISFFLIDCCN